MENIIQKKNILKMFKFNKLEFILIFALSFLLSCSILFLTYRKFNRNEISWIQNCSKYKPVVECYENWEILNRKMPPGIKKSTGGRDIPKS